MHDIQASPNSIKKELPAEQTIFSKLDMGRLAYWTISLTVLILPFFFIPSSLVTLDVAKGIMASVGITLALIFFVLHILGRGEFSFPRSKLAYGILGVPLVLGLSSFFGNPQAPSLYAFGLESYGALPVILGFVLLLITSQIFAVRKRIFYSYFALIVGFLVVVLFAVLKLAVGPDTLSFGVLIGKSSTPVGVWTDAAIFVGLGLMLVAAALDLELPKPTKAVLYAVLVVGLLLLAVFNFQMLWIVLVLFAVVFSLYNFRFRARISAAAIIIFCISSVFLANPVISSIALNDRIANALHVSNIEVRPSLLTTAGILPHSLKKNLLLGTGPGTFSPLWNLYKPEGINLTPYWGTNFLYGFGLLPTFFATTGILGILAWVWFFAFYIRTGIRALKAPETGISNFFTVSSFFGSLFLWVASFLYVPNLTILLLTFFLTGIFLGNSVLQGAPQRTFVFKGKKAGGFAAAVMAILVLVGGAALGYALVTRGLSSVYFNQAVIEANRDGDVDRAIQSLHKAASLSDFDFYYRTNAELTMLRMTKMVEGKAVNEETGKLVSQSLNTSLGLAGSAIARDPENYQNHLTLGRIYDALLLPPFSLPEAYEKAKSSYMNALALNPHDPEIYLLLGKLEIEHNNLDAAKGYIIKALAEKNDYVDAYFLSARIAILENNISQALKDSEALAALSPNNPGAFFQLGVLHYSAGEYKAAAEALIRAEMLVPDYANAKYFLGLTYYKLGDAGRALKEFQDLQKANPLNADLASVIENLQSNRDPLYKISNVKTRGESVTPPLGTR